VRILEKLRLTAASGSFYISQRWQAPASLLQERKRAKVARFRSYSRQVMTALLVTMHKQGFFVSAFETLPKTVPINFRKEATMLVLSRKSGESIVIGGGVKLTVVEVRGDRVRLGFEGPREIAIHRQEVWLQIAQESATTTN
jgi:carbon storage regulator